MQPPDPQRITMMLAALAGAGVWGLWTFFALISAGAVPAWRDYRRAGVNIAFAAIAGGLAAWFIGPAAAGLIPWVTLRDPHAFGFIIGAGFWELVPILLNVLKARAGKLGGDQ